MQTLARLPRRAPVWAGKSPSGNGSLAIATKDLVEVLRKGHLYKYTKIKVEIKSTLNYITKN